MTIDQIIGRLSAALEDIRESLAAKGISAQDHGFEEIAEDIDDISTGTDVSDTTAVESDVATGKQFHLADGSLAIGTAEIHDFYYATVQRSANKMTFPCTSASGSSFSTYYLEFDAGFKPDVISVVAETQTIVRSCYDSRNDHYVLAYTPDYHACEGFTVSENKVLIPVSADAQYTNYFVLAWA